MTRLLVIPSVWTLLVASAFALAASHAHAIDVVVHASAFEKALRGQLFKDHGRLYLRRPDRCNDPYLESPTVSIRQGRVYVGAHFAGRIGVLIGGVCQSVTEPSAITLSTRPVVRSQEVALEDVRVEGAVNPMMAAALENLMGADSLAPLRINLLEAVRTSMVPDKTAPYSIVVRALELSNLVVQSDELHVTVTGAVEVR